MTTPLLHTSFFAFFSQVNFLFLNVLTNPTLVHGEPAFGLFAEVAGRKVVNRTIEMSAITLVLYLNNSRPIFTYDRFRWRLTTWPTTTIISAIKNIALPMTFASGGIPRAEDTQTNFGKVLTIPELKLVIMKSSKESENARRAAPAMPGITRGKVT